MPPVSTTEWPVSTSMPSARASASTASPGLLAAIDDGSDRHAGALQIEGGLVGRIVRRIDADLRADGDAE